MDLMNPGGNKCGFLKKFDSGTPPLLK